MPDEEFVKLKLWLDAELTMLHEFFALVLLFVTHYTWLHVVLIIYIIWNIFYAAARINYVEKRHKGYTRIPKW